MRPSRRFLPLLVCAVGLLSLVVRGQSRPAIAVLDVGLPAVNEGPIPDESHRPNSPEALFRAAIRAADDPVRAGHSGRTFTAGRVIVKFKDETSDSAREAALRSVVAT